jgi:hypothetical protein
MLNFKTIIVKDDHPKAEWPVYQTLHCQCGEAFRGRFICWHGHNPKKQELLYHENAVYLFLQHGDHVMDMSNIVSMIDRPCPGCADDVRIVRVVDGPEAKEYCRSPRYVAWLGWMEEHSPALKPSQLSRVGPRGRTS